MVPTDPRPRPIRPLFLCPKTTTGAEHHSVPATTDILSRGSSLRFTHPNRPRTPPALHVPPTTHPCIPEHHDHRRSTYILRRTAATEPIIQTGMHAAALHTEIDHYMQDRIEELQQQLQAQHPAAEELEMQYELSRRIAPIDPLQGRRAAERAYTLSLATHNHQRRAQSLCAIGISYLGTGDYTLALEHLEQSARSCAELNYDFGRMDALIYQGVALASLSRYAEAFTCYDAARTICLNHNEEAGLRYIDHNIAVAHLQAGNYVQAMETYQQLLEQERSADDPAGIASVLNNMASLYTELHDYEQAVEIDMEALEIRRATGLQQEVALSLVNLANLHILLNRDEAAVAFNTEGMAIGKDLHLADIQISGLRNQGTLHSRQHKNAEALQTFDEALGLLAHGGAPRLRGDILYQKAKALLQEHGHREALPCLLEALAEARTTEEAQLQMQIQETLAQTYEALGEHQQAIEHYRGSLALLHELLGQDRQKALAAMEIRYRTERAEKERELYRLRSESLELQNLSKTRELTAMTMSLLQKKKELQNLRTHVERMAKNTDKASRIAHEIMAGIDSSLRSEQEWVLFEQQFSSLHPGFVQKILERCPELTPTELKVCSLLRITLSTKEIASLLNVSSRAVEGHRYHLRQKLRLPAKTSLATYLSSL